MKYDKITIMQNCVKTRNQTHTGTQIFLNISQFSKVEQAL